MERIHFLLPKVKATSTSLSIFLCPIKTCVIVGIPVMQGSRPEVFVPESVDNSYQGASGGDDYKPLVGVGSLGVVDVHVLATLQNSFVNAIQANGIRVGLSEDKPMNTLNYLIKYKNVSNDKVWIDEKSNAT